MRKRYTKHMKAKNPDSYLLFLNIPFLRDSNKPNKSSLCILNNIEFGTYENDAHTELVLL